MCLLRRDLDKKRRVNESNVFEFTFQNRNKGNASLLTFSSVVGRWNRWKRIILHFVSSPSGFTIRCSFVFGVSRYLCRVWLRRGGESDFLCIHQTLFFVSGSEVGALFESWISSVLCLSPSNFMWMETSSEEWRLSSRVRRKVLRKIWIIESIETNGRSVASNWPHGCQMLIGQLVNPLEAGVPLGVIAE